MAIKQLSDDDALALNGTTDADTGLEYPQLLQARWAEAILRGLNTFLLAALPDLRVVEVVGNADAVAVLPGAVVIAGNAYDYAGEDPAADALTDNDVTYIWLQLDGAGGVEIASAIDGTGWPAQAHVKLAEVTMVAGAITGIVDRRLDPVLLADDALVSFEWSIETQGDTGSASRVHLQARDSGGNVLNRTIAVRVRVADSAGWTDATNATIAAAGGSSLLDSVSATKDLILESDAAGLIELDLTDGTAETVTVRCGPADMGAVRGDYSPTQDVTHAAP